MQTISAAVRESDAGRPVGPVRLRSMRLVLSVASAVCILTTLAAQPSQAHGTDHAVTAAGASAGAAGGSATSEYLPADRDLLVKVRLAGLWEMPAGQMAARKGVNPRVREIGKMISEQHGELDGLVVTAAAQIGVTLPNEPNADQKSWLAEMDRATGPAFDSVFVDRLRAAHGKVFPVIAAVRTGTRNPVVRQLAQSANDFVLTHLTLLESTGLVDFSKLPPPPEPSPAPTPATAAPAAAQPAVAAPAVDTAELSIPAGAFPARPLLLVSLAGLALLLMVYLNHRSTTRRRKASWDGPQHRDHPSHRFATPSPPRPPLRSR